MTPWAYFKVDSPIRMHVWYQDLDHDGVITSGLSTVDDQSKKVIGNNAPRYRYNITANFLVQKDLTWILMFKGVIKEIIG